MRTSRKAPNGASPLADEQVVHRVLAGDRELFEILVRRHGQRLYRVALSIVPNTADAEDIVQESLANAYRHLRQYAGRATFLTWLVRITTNVSLQRISSARRRLVNFEVDGNDAISVPSAAPTPEESALAAESRALVRQAVSELGDNQRSVLTLRDLQQVDTATTAKVLGITEENVKVRLHRARRALREKLEARLSAPASAGAPVHPALLSLVRAPSSLATNTGVQAPMTISGGLQ